MHVGIDEPRQYVATAGVDHLVRRWARSIVAEFSYDAVAHDQGAGNDSQLGYDKAPVDDAELDRDQTVGGIS